MKKSLVIVLVRVSTKEQDWERQRRKVQKILRFFPHLEALEEIGLKVSGTQVLKTNEYRHALDLLSRRDVVGMIVPSIDRWFRYKLISELGNYCKPFEEMIEGKTAKLIYCTLNEKVISLDLHKREDQDILIDGARYASKEREVINARLTEGKDLGREDPECCIDPIPDGVEFTPYEAQTADSDGNKRTLVKGRFAYTDFAFNSVKPLFYRFLAGEPPYRLAKELGFGSIMNTRHTLKNLWWLGYKHRTKTATITEWDTSLNRERVRGKKDISEVKGCEKTRFVIATNLAKNPLIPQDVFDLVQAKLAVRKLENDRNKKHADEFLADPQFHCRKCGAKMYPRIGYQNRPDTYTCATRFTKGKGACDEPLFSRKDLDTAFRNTVYYKLKNPRFVDEKIEECFNEAHRAEAQAKVAAKERFIVEIEKKRSRVKRAIEDTDDPDLPSRLKQLNLELAEGKADLQMAMAAVSDLPDFDRKAMRRQVERDIFNLLHRPNAEQKQFFLKYVTRITAEERHPHPMHLAPNLAGPVPLPEYEWETADERPERPERYKVYVEVRITLDPEGIASKGQSRDSSCTNSTSRCSA